MKKIKLIGKKLYRTGFLKLYKNGLGDSSSGSSGSSGGGGGHMGYGGGYTGGKETHKPGYSGSGGSRGHGSQYSTSQSTRAFSNARRVEAARKKKIEDRKKEVGQMMIDDPTAFKGLMKSGDADAIAAANEQENKKTAQIKQDIVVEKKLKNLARKGLVAGIAGMVDVAGLGVVSVAAALASEISPQKIVLMKMFLELRQLGNFLNNNQQRLLKQILIQH